MKLSVHCNAHHYLSSSLIHCRCQRSSNKRRSHPLKEEMILALYSFRENSEDNEDDMELDVDREADSSNWVDLVDRGGLYHVCMEFYNFLYSLEIQVKQIMRKDNVQKLKDGISEAIVKRAQENDDVCFWWRTVCSTVEVDSNTAEALLPQITEHYIIVRGFAFATRWMEVYKCKRKKMSRSLKDLEKNILSIVLYSVSFLVFWIYKNMT